jgi:hypothetical protein
VKVNMARGTNNYGELKDLHLLLKVSLDIGINNLQVLGEFILVTNWMNENAQIKNN